MTKKKTTPVTPSTYSWTNSSGDNQWTTPSNWLKNNETTSTYPGLVLNGNCENVTVTIGKAKISELLTINIDQNICITAMTVNQPLNLQLDFTPDGITLMIGSNYTKGDVALTINAETTFNLDPYSSLFSYNDFDINANVTFFMSGLSYISGMNPPDSTRNPIPSPYIFNSQKNNPTIQFIANERANLNCLDSHGNTCQTFVLNGFKDPFNVVLQNINNLSIQNLNYISSFSIENSEVDIYGVTAFPKSATYSNSSEICNYTGNAFSNLPGNPLSNLANNTCYNA